MTTRKSWACSRDHLRVCGADFAGTVTFTLSTGSTPRVRSKLDVHAVDRVVAVITSTCTEQTVVFHCVLSQLNGVEYLIYALRRVS